MTKDEALRLALEALKQIDEEMPFPVAKLAQKVIKEALAQPEPNYKKALEVWLDKTEWVQETVKPHELGMHRADVLKQRIEATLAQPEQEPIGQLCEESYGRGQVMWFNKPVDGSYVYTTPPQRTWVGLTDEDFLDACQIAERGNYLVAFQRIQAKLKEKNT